MNLSYSSNASIQRFARRALSVSVAVTILAASFLLLTFGRASAQDPSAGYAPRVLDTAASLSISTSIPATQGDFVDVPVIFGAGGNSITSLAFEFHYDQTKLKLSLGPNSGGTRSVLSVTFPGLTSTFVAGAFVNTGAESDVEVFVHLDPGLAGNPPSPLPTLPNGILPVFKFQAIGIGPVTTPVTFELVDPPASAGLVNGSSLVDGVGTTNGSVLISPAVQSVSLVPGQNLIGLTVIPTSSVPASVFGMLGSNLKSVFQYQCAQNPPFVFYNPNIPAFLNTMTTVDIQHGYWVEVITTGTLQVTGTVPTYPVSIPLCVGTNMIAYPSKVNVALPGALNASIAGFWNSVFGEPFPFKFYNPNIPPFLNTLTNMGPGRGYYLDMNTAVTLTVNTGP